MVRLNALAKLALVPILVATILFPATPDTPVSALNSQARVFNLEEATIADITAAFDAGALSCRQLAQMYLNRIAAYLASDRHVPFNQYGIFRHYPELDLPGPERP